MKAVKSSSTKVKISWKKIDGADGYEIAKMTKSGKKYKVQTTYTERKNVSSTKIKATKGKTYYYKVRAYHNVKVNGKTKKVYGNWSDVKSFKLKK